MKKKSGIIYETPKEDSDIEVRFDEKEVHCDEKQGMMFVDELIAFQDE